MTEPINDAVAYGVSIVPAQAAPGATYWKVIRVHHLRPQENNDRHHIFMDAVDAAGNRLFGTRLLVSWDGGGHEVVIEKPVGEPGANEPLWKWQIASVQAQGLPSDRVEGLRTNHDDEPPGNTFFHHSFEVVFQRTEAAAPNQSIISGRVPGGAGHTLALRVAGATAVMATKMVDADETYAFTQLPAGRYTITDAHSDHSVGPVEVDGVGSITVNFPPSPTDKALARYVLFGPPDQPVTQLYLGLLADHVAMLGLAFGFAISEAVQSARVTLVGQHPDATRASLEAAGVQVEQLPTDASALLAALRTGQAAGGQAAGGQAAGGL